MPGKRWVSGPTAEEVQGGARQRSHRYALAAYDVRPVPPVAGLMTDLRTLAEIAARTLTL
jgi:hypothetical protein